MGVRDALLLNLTGSNFQALQTNDTARLKGDLSLQKDDGTEVLGIDVSTANLNLSGGITGSGNISSSLSSTGSFGRVVGTTFHGDGSALKDDLPRSVGIVTQSAQLAAQISGAFTEGFFFSSSISGGMGITGSFGKVEASFLFGDGSGVAQTIPRHGLVTSSGQLADDISGSFNKGFEFSGAITAGDTVWAAGGCLIQNRMDLGARGTVNSTLVAGGAKCNYPGTTALSCTEEWNGTTFSEVNDMIDAKTGDVGGTVNDAYFGGGNAGINTEQWNGTNWSEGHSMPSSNASQHLGGNTPSELYFIMTNGAPGNGFSDYNTAAGTVSNCTAIPYTSGWYQGYQSHHGDMSAGVVSAGWGTSSAPLTNTATVVWNGTAWSDCGDILLPASGRAGWRNARQVGSVNAGAFTGGESGPPGGPAWANQCVDNAHQGWDGSVWSTKTQLPQPVFRHAATGTSNATFIVGGTAGHPGPPYSHMRSGSFLYEEDMTLGSFGRLEFISASGDATGLQSSIQYETNPAFNVLTGSSQIASRVSGSFNKGFEFVGQIKAALGGVFASSTDFPDHWMGAGGGSMLAGTAIVAGGSYRAQWPPQATDNTALYDGSSWTEVNNLTSGTRSANTIALTGNSSAGLFFGHCGGPAPTEEWNGTNWTEVADIPDPAGSGAAGGGESSESAIWVNYFSGRGNKWDGTSWSETNNTNICRYDAGGTGAKDNFMIAGGINPFCDTRTCTEIYNGTNWSVATAMPIGTYEQYSMGQTNDAIFAGGRNIEVGGNTSINCSQTFDGSAWAIGPNIVTQRFADSGGSKYSGPAAAGATNQAWLGGGNRNGVPYNSADTEVFPGFVISGSFGKLDANTLHGDGSNLSNVPLPTGLVTGSAQIASRISGSFNKGFGFSGEISGSATSTGSFGRIEADFLHGDGSSIKDDLPRSTGIISSSKQIASQISGSFTSGFGYEGTIQTAPGGVWSDSGGAAFPGGRSDANAIIGIQKAFLQVGRAPGTTTEAYEFNGSNWSSINDFNTARQRMGGVGTVDGAIIFGGQQGSSPGKTETEIYDGSSWSEVNDLINGQDHLRGAGVSSNAALSFGGVVYPSGPGNVGKTEEWNGTNWTAVNDMINPASDWHYYKGGGSGESSEAAIAAGNNPYGTAVELWNGTNWSIIASLSLGRQYNILSGTTNDAITFGGRNPSTNASTVTENYNGISWSTTSNMISSRNDAGSGTGGNVGASQGVATFGSFSNTATEFYDGNIASASFHNIEATNLIGDGSQFSASLQSQLLTSVSQISNSISGSFTSGFDLQGGVSASFGLYGGTWSEVNPLNQARAGGAVGNKAAALAVGGRPPGGAPYQSTCTELWNGVNWSVATARNNAASGRNIAGNSEAAISNQVPSGVGYNEIWNGINWSEASNANTHGFGSKEMAGNVDAAVEAGGFNGSSQIQDDVAEWNGSTWSEATNMPTNRGGGAMFGTQNDAMYAGGAAPTITNNTIVYDGTNWSAGVSLPVVGYRHAGDGSTNSAISAGAHPASPGAWPQYNAYELGGLAWYRVADMTRAPAGAFDMDIAGDPKGALAVGGYIRAETEEFSSYGSDSSGSFGQLRGTVGGEIKTDMFNITSSTFKLPLFSDADLNYNSLEPEESTGSISGSVVRAGDVNVLNKPGNFFFHTDYNALGFTYMSASIYSQSIDFRRCGYQTGSVYTASSGFITQSHYCYHNVIQYITGSYT